MASSSMLIDALVNTKASDLDELDIEIHEQLEYLERLKKIRKVLVTILGKVESKDDQDDEPRKKDGRSEIGNVGEEKLNEASHKLVKLLQKGPKSYLELSKVSGLHLAVLAKALRTDWFEANADKRWQLSAKGREFGLL